MSCVQVKELQGLVQPFRIGVLYVWNLLVQDRLELNSLLDVVKSGMTVVDLPQKKLQCKTCSTEQRNFDRSFFYGVVEMLRS